MDASDNNNKIKVLREVLESIMWEMETVRSKRWEELPQFSLRKQELMQKLDQYDWTPSPLDRNNLELEMLKGQIRDLEFQTKKMIEAQKDIVSAQLTDLRRRYAKWQKVIAPYKRANPNQ
jgi:DNA repair exonuclease SbcCD ATPase subunit